MRKVLFKRVLKRNGKNKQFLEFDVEKDCGIIFLIFLFANNKDNNIKY